MINTNYKFGEVNKLASQIEAQEEKVTFHNVFGNDNGGVMLVAFKGGQQLTEHIAPAEVMVYALEGEIEFTMNGDPNILHGGDFLLMGADVPHSVLAKSDAKLAIIKIKP